MSNKVFDDWWDEKMHDPVFRFWYWVDGIRMRIATASRRLWRWLSDR